MRYGVKPYSKRKIYKRKKGGGQKFMLSGGKKRKFSFVGTKQGERR